MLFSMLIVEEDLKNYISFAVSSLPLIYLTFQVLQARRDYIKNQPSSVKQESKASKLEKKCAS